VAARIHVVRRGECLASLAAHYGVDDARALHDHPDNAELKRARPNRHLLLPGDVVRIPEEEAPRRSVRSRSVNRFAAAPPRVPISVRLRNADGTPMAGVEYELVVGSERLAGVTRGNGQVEEEVAATALRAYLVLYGDDGAVASAVTLAIGYVDPPDTPSGWRGRLKNLGHWVGDDAESIRAFQRAEGLAESGTMDEATRAALESRHGC